MYGGMSVECIEKLNDAAMSILNTIIILYGYVHFSCLKTESSALTMLREVSISCGSKVIAKDKKTNRQHTHTQTGQNMPPIIRFGGIKNAYIRMLCFTCLRVQVQVRSFVWALIKPG